MAGACFVACGGNSPRPAGVAVSCPGTALPDGVYRFVVTVGGREDCVDVDSNDLSRVQHYFCNDSDTQQWTVRRQSSGCYTLFNGRTGNCLGLNWNVDGGLSFMSCSRGEPALWHFDDVGGGQYHLTNGTQMAAGNFVCLDQRSQEPDHGGRVQAWSCNDSVHQNFYVRRM